MTDISKAIQSLNTKGGNSHEYVMTGTPTSESEWVSNVKFISGSEHKYLQEKLDSIIKMMSKFISTLN